MYSIALIVIALASPLADSTASIEGVWTDPRGNLLYAGNGRLDWQVEDRYSSSMVDIVPDGTIFGTCATGRDIYAPFRAMSKATDTADWGNRDKGSVPYPFWMHLFPDVRTYSKPLGEARLTITASPNGRPSAVALDVTAEGSRVPSHMTYVRALPMEQLTMAGKFADKDVTVEIQDEPGRLGTIHGSVTYLGKKRPISGRRIMGRAGFLTFDDSRFGDNGSGYVAWYPSYARTIDIRDRNQTETDQIAIYFRFADGSTATGIHKVLKRS